MTIARSLTAGNRSAALTAVCLSALMFGLEISSVPAILPTLEQVLQADFIQLQWIMNAYTIGVTMVLMATGALADRFGRKRVFMASIIAFGLASLACGLTESVAVLIGGRFLQGLSGGAMLVCQIAILSHQFRTARERSMAFGWWGIVSGVGLGFGPIIGGTIVALWNWEWVFLIHVGLSFATVLLAARGVQESRDPDATQLDFIGVTTLSVAVFCLAFYITQGAQLGFANPAALATLSISIASLVAFIIAEKSSARPMFDFSVFRIRPFSGAIIGSAAMNISFWPFMIYLPIWFQAGLGYDSIAAGLGLLAYTLPALVIPPLAERLSLRYQPCVVIPAGLFTIGLGFMVMKLGSSGGDANWLTMLPGCILSGVGLGLTNTPVTNTTTGALPPARSGMASGIDMSARMISLAINIPVMGFILVEGVLSSLRANMPFETDPSVFRPLAEKIAAGTAGSPGFGASDIIVRQALAEGFGWVMIYGGVSVWLLATISFVVFGRRRPIASV
jgi:EmrB/QacA subfamily drug resistance transporter